MIKGSLLDYDFYFSSQFVCFHDIFHDHLFLYDIMLRKIPSLNLGLNYAILISDLTWREFKAVEQLIDRPGLRLSFLDGVLEIRKMLL